MIAIKTNANRTTVSPRDTAAKIASHTKPTLTTANGRAWNEKLTPDRRLHPLAERVLPWAGVSRRANRIRAQLAATITPVARPGDMFICRTRDISQVGCFLTTQANIDVGTQVEVAIFDRNRGELVQEVGEVSRVLTGARPGVGIRFAQPSDGWRLLCQGQAASSGSSEKPARRLRILVVGDERRQRGALALYVTSGWDVQFATDLDGAIEALREVANLDAVISEHDLADAAWPAVLDEARRIQPRARRIVRGGRNGAAPDPRLVHRFVDRDTGLDALIDALTADLSAR